MTWCKCKLSLDRVSGRPHRAHLYTTRSLSHGLWGSVSHLGQWSLLAWPAACPADSLKRGLSRAVHDLGMWGETRVIFVLTVSISHLLFRDGVPSISLLFSPFLIASGCQKGRKSWSRGRVYIFSRWLNLFCPPPAPWYNVDYVHFYKNSHILLIIKKKLLITRPSLIWKIEASILYGSDW